MGSRLRTLTHTERTTNGSTSATWAAISTLRLRRRPSAAPTMRKPRPAATPGTTRGESRSVAQSEAARGRPRARPSAAAVPMGMARATAPAVTRRLFHIARWNCG